MGPAMLAYAAFERNGLPESSTSPGIPQLFVNCRNQAITLIEKWMPIKGITKALRVRLTGEEEKRLVTQGGVLLLPPGRPCPVAGWPRGFMRRMCAPMGQRSPSGHLTRPYSRTR
jgi:hypothetical protein